MPESHFLLTSIYNPKSEAPGQLAGGFVIQLTERIGADALCFFMRLYHMAQLQADPPWLSLWESFHRR